jgi:hypothetical protein
VILLWGFLVALARALWPIPLAAFIGFQSSRDMFTACLIAAASHEVLALIASIAHGLPACKNCGAKPNVARQVYDV